MARNSNVSSKCWICGENADSREHSIKRSEVTPLFTSAGPEVVVATFEAGKQLSTTKVQGSKSKSLTFAKSICQKCNNETTQPYDIAQSEFVNFATANKDEIVRVESCQFGTEKQVDLQLYYVKHLGCQIIDGRYDVKTKPLATALKNRVSLSGFYLQFRFANDAPPSGAGYQTVGFSQDCTTFMSNIFHPGQLLVSIFYDLKPCVQQRDEQNFWHPLVCSDKIPFVNG